MNYGEIPKSSNSPQNSPKALRRRRLASRSLTVSANTEHDHLSPPLPPTSPIYIHAQSSRNPKLCRRNVKRQLLLGEVDEEGVEGLGLLEFAGGGGRGGQLHPSPLGGLVGEGGRREGEGQGEEGGKEEREEEGETHAKAPSAVRGSVSLPGWGV